MKWPQLPDCPCGQCKVFVGRDVRNLRMQTMVCNFERPTLHGLGSATFHYKYLTMPHLIYQVLIVNTATGITNSHVFTTVSTILGSAPHISERNSRHSPCCSEGGDNGGLLPTGGCKNLATGGFESRVAIDLGHVLGVCGESAELKNIFKT